MESTSFCAYQDLTSDGYNHCSCESTVRPLVVNCAGCFNTQRPFTTHNSGGRLDYYLMLVLEGCLSVPIDGALCIAKKGSVLLFPPHYSYKYSFDGKGTLSYAWVHFTGSEVQSCLSECGIEVLPTLRNVKNSHMLSQHFSLLYDAFSNQDRFRDRELSAILECLLIALGRAFGGSEESQNNLSTSIRHIMTSYSTEISIPELAAMEHMSIPRYHACFKKLMGTSPTKYILRLRITSACDLLLHTDMSVKEIAALCGYRDPYFFSRAFKAYVGISPRNYRLQENVTR